MIKNNIWNILSDQNYVSKFDSLGINYWSTIRSDFLQINDANTNLQIPVVTQSNHEKYNEMNKDVIFG